MNPWRTRSLASWSWTILAQASPMTLDISLLVHWANLSWPFAWATISYSAWSLVFSPRMLDFRGLWIWLSATWR